MSKARSPRVLVSITMGTRYSAIVEPPGRVPLMQLDGCEYSLDGVESQPFSCVRRCRMDSRARIEKRAVYPVGRREVWAAITRPEELSRWFGSEVVALDLRPGGRIVFRDGSGESHRALVEVVEAPSRFAFRWLPAPVRAGSDRRPGSR